MGNPPETEGSIGKIPINSEFSSKPCLITGGYSKIQFVIWSAVLCGIASSSSRVPDRVVWLAVTSWRWHGCADVLWKSKDPHPAGGENTLSAKELFTQDWFYDSSWHVIWQSCGDIYPDTHFDLVWLIQFESIWHEVCQMFCHTFDIGSACSDRFSHMCADICTHSLKLGTCHTELYT